MKKLVFLTLILFQIAACDGIKFNSSGSDLVCNSYPIYKPMSDSQLNAGLNVSLSNVNRPSTYGSCAAAINDIEQSPAKISSILRITSKNRKNFENDPNNIESFSEFCFDPNAPVVAFGENQVNEVSAVNEGGVTNTQEKNIDESDIVKVSEKQIFIYKPGSIEVVNRETLDLEHSVSTDLSHVGLFFVNQKLVVIGYESEKNRNTSKVQVYKTEDSRIPELIYSKTIIGPVKSARLKDNSLFLLTDQNLNTITAEINDIDCNNIYKPLSPIHEQIITTLWRFDLSSQTEEITQSNVSAVGRFDNIYMSENNAYLYSRTHNLTYIGATTGVAKIPLNGELSISSNGQVKGRTIGTWSFKELENENLAVVSHEPIGSRVTILEEDRSSNSLQSLSTLGEIARGEDLKSVRFKDNYAYLVTFLEVDPFFVVDISDQTQLSIESEVKLPGFSTYMHPVLDNHVLGFGQVRGNLALSLFNVEDSSQAKLVEQKVFPTSAFASDLFFSHQSFYYDNVNQLIGFPVGANYESSENPYTEGAYIIKVRKNGVGEAQLISHNDIITAQCSGSQPRGKFSYTRSKDINRVFDLDGRLITISMFGLKQHNVFGLEDDLKSTTFTRSENDCEAKVYPLGSFY